MLQTKTIILYGKVVVNFILNNVPVHYLFKILNNQKNDFGFLGNKQGRVQVGRGHIWGHLIIWAGAVRPKTAKIKKSVMDGRTDRRTDQRTDGPTKRGVESCSTRLKKLRDTSINQFTYLSSEIKRRPPVKAVFFHKPHCTWWRSEKIEWQRNNKSMTNQ